MYVYVYRSDFLCDRCGESVRQAIPCPGNPNDEYSYDSDDWPKGPFPNGGGEADCPQHCSRCEIFLENPLTTGGYKYLKSVLDSSEGNSVVLTLWSDFYNGIS